MRLISSCRRAAMAAVMLLAAASAARAAEPDVLKQVPGDAYGVIVINNARTLASKISNSATRLKVTIPPDLVGAATRSIGIREGFDANSSVAMVLLKPATEKEGESYFAGGVPPMVLLLPTTDAKAMLAPFSPTDADKDGISQVTLPENPDEKGFVAVVAGKWVALAQHKEELAAYLARGDSFAKSASPETLKVFDANDLVIWGNVEKLGKGADKWLDDQHTTITGMMDLQNMARAQDSMNTVIQKQGVEVVFSLAREFISDARASMITMRLTDSGATLGLVGDFKPESPIGKFVSSQAGQGAVTLQGLPKGDFIAAGTARWNSDTMAQIVGKFVDQMLNDPAIANDQRLPALRQSFELSRQMMQLTQGMRFVLLDPPAGAKDGLLNGAFIVDTTDAKKLLDLQLASVQNSQAMLGGTNPMAADLKTSVTVTPNASTVKGVTFTRMNAKFSLRDETPDKPISAESRIGAQMIERVYGPDGMNINMGIVGKNMLVVYGNDPATLDAAVTAAQSNSTDLGTSPAIAASKDDVVANPVAIAYLPITRWVLLGQNLAAGLGGIPAPRPGTLPASVTGAPPVVMSAGITGKMLTTEIHVPIATITGVQAAVERLEETARPDGNLP